MAKILEFKAPKGKSKKTANTRNKKSSVSPLVNKNVNKPKNPGNALCREGHHKWEVDKSTDFAVKKGQLITVYRCKHCGKTKTKTE